ncbi:MAG: nitrous oxide reductase family maturation protein NosD [Promethearchaeota archaeon]
MRCKLKLYILTLGIVFAILSITNYNIFNGRDGTIKIHDETNLSPPNSAGYWTRNFIHIDNNWSDTALTYEWCSGDGSWSAPYVIENVTIDASTSPTGSGIYIQNSKNEYFFIRNCTVNNATNGIRLENTDNGTLTQNYCSTNNGVGIVLYNSCRNNTISYNIVNGNSNRGIQLNLLCDNNTISDNDANSQVVGIDLFRSSNNYILRNQANGNSEGIRLVRDCNYNTISGNTVNDNNAGIYGDVGLDYNTISGNIANGNNVGINLNDNFNRGTVSDNNVNNNNIGIVLDGMVDNNEILNNIACFNDLYGIYITYSRRNNVLQNIVQFNKEIGIYIFGDSYLNVISQNTIIANKMYGIMLEEDDINAAPPTYNNITSNIFQSNIIYDLYLDWCEDTQIFTNCFNNYTIIETAGVNNLWDDGVVGNYWDDYNGYDVDPKDGLGDISHTVAINIVDKKPLMNPIWEDTDDDGLYNLEEYLPGKDGLRTNSVDNDTDNDAFIDGIEFNAKTNPLDPTWYPMPNLKVSHFSPTIAYFNTSFILDFSISNDGIWKAKGVIVIIRCEELDLTLFDNTDSPFNIEADDTEYISIGCLPFEITGEFTLSLIVDPGNLINEIYSLKNGSLRTDWELDNSMQTILSIISMKDNGDSGGGNGMDPVLIFSLGSIVGVATGVIITLGVVRLRKRRKLG